jgi:hypothetical protein
MFWLCQRTTECNPSLRHKLVLKDLKSLPKKPNCLHKSDDCAAFSLSGVWFPFFYGEYLYYYHFEKGFCRADKDGTNQTVLLKNYDDYRIFPIKYSNGKIILIAQKQIIDSKGLNTDSSRVYVYDFNSFHFVFETEFKYDCQASPYGIIGDNLYLLYTGRDYGIGTADDTFEMMRDKNSEYWKDFVYEIREMPIYQENPSAPDYKVLADIEYLEILDNCYYYTLSNETPANLYRANPETDETDVIYTSYAENIEFYIHDNKIFIFESDIDKETGDRVNNKCHYYNGDEVKEFEKFLGVFVESGEYFFGSLIGSLQWGYVKKSDVYAGDFEDKFTEWDFTA